MQCGVPFNVLIRCSCFGYIGINADGAAKYELARTKQSAVVRDSSVRTAQADVLLPYGSLSASISFDFAGN